MSAEFDRASSNRIGSANSAGGSPAVMSVFLDRLERFNGTLEDHIQELVGLHTAIGLPIEQKEDPRPQVPDTPGAIGQIAKSLDSVSRRIDIAAQLARSLRRLA